MPKQINTRPSYEYVFDLELDQLREEVKKMMEDFLGDAEFLLQVVATTDCNVMHNMIFGRFEAHIQPNGFGQGQDVMTAVYRAWLTWQARGGPVTGIK